MVDYDALQAAGALARIHKEAALTGGQALGHAADVVLTRMPKVLRKGFKEMGEETTKAMAIKGQEPGVVAELAGRAVKYTPHAAGLLGLGYVAEPHLRPYMEGKVRQFRARQAATRPYFDPRTQRFM